MTMTQQHPKVEFFTTREKLEAGREQTVDVLIRVTPPAQNLNNSSRPDLNLSLVLDRSGSMEGEKMVRAREAAMFCVDQMLATDRLSVVTFDDRIEVLFPSEQITNKQSMKDLISGVAARGSTALHEAWVRGGLTVSEHLLMPIAQSGGGNAWHVVEPEDMKHIFQIELEGLIAQFAHTVSLSLIPADGVRVVDVLNDFELTETGRYRLPNMQAGSPLEIVVQLKIGAQEVGPQMRLLDLRLGFTPQEARNAEVLKQAHTIEFASRSQVESMPENHEVVKAVQFLMNARARNEAMNRMDQGDYSGAELILGSAVGATRVACASFASMPSVMQECASLEETAKSLKDRLKDKMSRKKLAYAAYSRRSGK